MNPNPFAALNHLTVPFSMERVLSYSTTRKPSGEVYAGDTTATDLINGGPTLEGVRAVRQRKGVSRSQGVNRDSPEGE